MEEKNLVPEELIESKILLIRGKKVMLDRDLAALYGVETRVLNQAVQRNIKRFPNDFMFSLTREEIRNISQIVISSKIKHAPNVLAFTEQGVAMLSGIRRWGFCFGRDDRAFCQKVSMRGSLGNNIRDSEKSGILFTFKIGPQHCLIFFLILIAFHAII